MHSIIIPVVILKLNTVAKYKIPTVGSMIFE
jgi:hypothetical protein